MKFVFELLLKSRDNVVCVDGAFNAELQISHWHGNSSPNEFKADTTTEMVFKLIEHSDKDKYLAGIDVVSNNHFDSDGLLSAFIILNPNFALENKKSLVNIALTGDFAEFTTDDAFKANCVFESFLDSEKGIFKNVLAEKTYPEALQTIYEKAFELIPDILNDVDKYEMYWKEEYKFFRRSEESFASQSSVFSNYNNLNLSVIESAMPLHPVTKFMKSENDIVLSAEKASAGNKYTLEYKYYTWFDTARTTKLVRKKFEPLAEKLNLIELNKEGLWRVLGGDPVFEWDYKLIFSDDAFNLLPSRLKVFEVENILFDVLPLL